MKVTYRQVIKLGGSLLDWHEMPLRFHRWLELNQSEQTIIVVGGGSLVNEYRRHAFLTPRDEIASHWHCIELMSQTAANAAEKLNLPVTRELSACNPISVFNVSDWMREKDRGPCSWQVTSDSIAALVAARWEADKLTLLKSTLPPVNRLTLNQLPDGLVDEYFPIAARMFLDVGSANPRTIRIVNLRDDQFEERALPIAT